MSGIVGPDRDRAPVTANPTTRITITIPWPDNEFLLTRTMKKTGTYVT